MREMPLTTRYQALDDAVAELVAAAPARLDYWGVTLRARHATTRPADVVAHYYRVVQERAWGYGASIPREMHERMRCDVCGATGCKMWREYPRLADYTKILCGPCALKDQGESGTIDANGYVSGGLNKCDQIGWMVPAVPTFDGTFWGYTSVPEAGVRWWRGLPSVPR